MQYQQGSVKAEVFTSALFTGFTTACYWGAKAMLHNGTNILEWIGLFFVAIFGFFSFIIMFMGLVEALQLFVKTESRRTKYRRWSMKWPNLALTGSAVCYIGFIDRPVLRFMFMIFCIQSFLIVVFGYAARFTMERMNEKLVSVR